MCERFHKTILNEFHQVAFRKKLSRSREELQPYVDQWIHYYNKKRPHSGKYCFGKTPMQTLLDSIQPAKDKVIGSKFSVTINTECQTSS
ncbi:MAG: integrase core domain-containing protein [Candidatus Cloacimonetes bacterium]|nr:integrase core domain-containing protein [Candidatus Cloacimonadota bacterium]